MLKKLRARWDTHRRTIDKRLLWPICRDKAEGDLSLARTIFYVHTRMDSAWQSLSEEEIRKQVEELT